MRFKPGPILIGCVIIILWNVFWLFILLSALSITKALKQMF